MRRLSRPRVINSQMNVSLPVELHEQLRDRAWEERRTLSDLCRELLEEGLSQRQEAKAAVTE